MDPLSLIVAAAANEKPKTAFYIIGGGLAAWAVVLSAFGLSRPEFPRNGAAARGVMAFSLLIVAAAMATAVLVS